MTLLAFFQHHYSSGGSERSFRVDDQTSANPSFCKIFVRLSKHDAEAFELVLERVPWDERVQRLAERLGGKWSGTSARRTLALSLNVTCIAAIRRLAEAIRSVVGRGRRYSDANWKWVTRRTADSLHLFADRLKIYRHTRRDPLPRKPGRLASQSAHLLTHSGENLESAWY